MIHDLEGTVGRIPIFRFCPVRTLNYSDSERPSEETLWNPLVRSTVEPITKIHCGAGAYDFNKKISCSAVGPSRTDSWRRNLDLLFCKACYAVL